ncbi:MAG: hypothetical protein KatS3mg003_0725 [Candidatus Nitrosocaldaceae archaeon]|nr:MAG: hypothetical protein KatS3mg003_0725 [Candidatus Nitrosocaldaceae archaeon]
MIDGAYAIDHLLITDIAVSADVVVEGLTPPNERRYCPEPRYLCKIFTINHNVLTFLCNRAHDYNGIKVSN